MLCLKHHYRINKKTMAMAERINVTLEKLVIEKTNSGICTGTRWSETRNYPVLRSPGRGAGLRLLQLP